MAAEALVPVAKYSLGKSEKELAELGAKQAHLKNPMRRARDLRSAAEGYARRAVVFHNDLEVHAKTRKLSDGFEHGFGSYDEIKESARAIGDSAMKHIRRAIIELSPLRDKLKNRLLNESRFDTPLGIHGHVVAIGQIVFPPTENAADRIPPIDMSATKLENVAVDDKSRTVKFEVTFEGAVNRKTSKTCRSAPGCNHIAGRSLI